MEKQEFSMRKPLWISSWTVVLRKISVSSTQSFMVTILQLEIVLPRNSLPMISRWIPMSCELFSSLQLFRKNLFIIHWTSNEVNSSGTFENKKQMRYLGVSEIRTEFKRYANIYDARIKSGVQVARRGRAARSQKVEKQKEDEEEEEEDEVEVEEEEEEEEEEEDRPCAGRHTRLEINVGSVAGEIGVKKKSSVKNSL
ncbi:hypothetical protein V1477_003773 [Vespula maculifrons]|uniref:Uncharacterized protein n=1 Tax=Vespula maculifrons TaxID=7453 RepID=A0ABD2CRY3_VESMC